MGFNGRGEVESLHFTRRPVTKCKGGWRESVNAQLNPSAFLQHIFYRVGTLGLVFKYGFPPETDHSVTHFLECLVEFQIALYIAFYLGEPVFPSCSDTVLLILPIVTVPKFGIAEDRDLLSLERDVGFAGQILAVLTIVYASGPQFLTQDYLNLRVLVTDRFHVGSTLFGSMVVHVA